LELRRFTRAPINKPVLFAPKDDDVLFDGVATDISLGGMFISSEYAAPFGVEIVIHLTLDGAPPSEARRRAHEGQASTELILPAIVRWVRAGGMGVQFRLLGARETFEITEMVRRHEDTQSRPRPPRR
jgi:PilZ domain-containing protein